MIRCVCTSRNFVLSARAFLLLHAALSQKLPGTFFQESSRDFLICVFCRVLSSELVERKQENTNSNQRKTRLEASKPLTV